MIRWEARNEQRRRRGTGTRAWEQERGKGQRNSEEQGRITLEKNWGVGGMRKRTNIVKKEQNKGTGPGTGTETEGPGEGNADVTFADIFRFKH
jgi:hypothetical protein